MDPGLNVRKACFDDASKIANLYNEVYHGKYSRPDCTVPDKIRELMAKETTFWYLVSEGPSLVGSTVGVAEPWNLSFDIGRMAVRPEHANRGLAFDLCVRVREEAFAAGYEVSVGTARNGPAFRVSQKLGMFIVGFFPGRYHTTTRETHLSCFRLSEPARLQRVAPSSRNWIYNIPVVNSLCGYMKLPKEEAPYPPEVVVGPPSQHSIQLGFSYHPKDEAAYLGSIQSGIGELPQYMQVIVLADKIEEIQFFLRLGFRICVFLPAWFKKGGKRYDCVGLANSISEPLAPDPTSQDVLQIFVEQFRQPNEKGEPPK